MKRTVVYIPGVWDLLHVGHLAILERASKMGDILIVGVPTDPVVIQDKGDPPIIPCKDRVRMLQALEVVDLAIPYDALEFLSALKRYDVDVLVVGDTWGTDTRHREATEYIHSIGGRVVSFPYTAEASTTDIKARVLAQGGVA